MTRLEVQWHIYHNFRTFLFYAFHIYNGGDKDLRIWQEGMPGQECHTGSSLELDFLFIPLLLWVGARLGVLELEVLLTTRAGVL